MAETATLTPPPLIPSPQAVPDAVPTRNRPAVSKSLLEKVNTVRQQFDDQNDGKRNRIQARQNPDLVTKPPEDDPARPVVPDANATPADPTKPAVVADDPQAGIKAALSGDKETNMAALRKAREDAEARAKTLEVQLAEAQGRIPTDYEQLKKDRDLLITEIEKRDVTASPRFKEKYDKPMEQQLGQIKKTLSLTDVKPDDFLVVVQMPESKERNAKIGELMEGLDRVSAGKIENALSQFDAIRDQRSQDMLDPKAQWQENQRDILERQTKAKQQQTAVLEGALTKAKTSIPWFKKIDGNETWNNRVDQIEQRSREFWSGGHSPEELAELTVAGTLAPLFSETIGLLSAENEKLNEELAGLRGAKPKTAAGTTASASTTGKGKYEGFGSIGAMVRAKAMERSK
jgi:hypothetical protein